MRDIDVIKAMLATAGITFEENPLYEGSTFVKVEVDGDQKKPAVGFSGCYSILVFNKNGALVNVGVAE